MKTNNLKVLVHGPGFWPYVQMFNNEPGYEAVLDFDKADAVCFTGGADVEPRRYGEIELDTTYSDRHRDQNDLWMFNKAQAAGKLLIGICRGGQFLNVMNGGKLWQDIDGHTVDHELVDKQTGEVVLVTSTHHQEMRPTDEAVILATARVAYQKRSATLKFRNVSEPDIEAVWYRASKSLCFQPHPEFYGADSTRQYFFSLLDRCRDDITSKSLKAG